MLSLRRMACTAIFSCALTACSVSHDQVSHQCSAFEGQLGCDTVPGSVCARVDTGVRCITTPCPSYKFQPYDNACAACANDKVQEIFSGSCDAYRQRLEDPDKTP
jgi:hypothetical protein